MIVDGTEEYLTAYRWKLRDSVSLSQNGRAVIHMRIVESSASEKPEDWPKIVFDVSLARSTSADAK